MNRLQIKAKVAQDLQGILGALARQHGYDYAVQFRNYYELVLVNKYLED